MQLKYFVATEEKLFDISDAYQYEIKYYILRNSLIVLFCCGSYISVCGSDSRCVMFHVFVHCTQIFSWIMVLHDNKDATNNSFSLNVRI